MSYKILTSYILSAIAAGSFLICIFLLWQHYSSQLSLSNDRNSWIMYALSWILLGLINGLAINALKSITSSAFFELLTCIIICAIALSVYVSKMQTVLEGLEVWSAGMGVIVGVILFFVKKIILKLLNIPKFKQN
jgi:hypothetical protein